MNKGRTKLSNALLSSKSKYFVLWTKAGIQSSEIFELSEDELNIEKLKELITNNPKDYITINLISKL